jgi:aspartate/methionine/tyrosine aminotransferase
MKIKPFALERYFAKHEFRARYLLSCSDCEALQMSDLVAMADDELTEMWHNLKLHYTETPGHPMLRNEVAALYEGVAPDDVLVVIPEEGIFLLMNTLLESGDHVVVTYPAYQSLYEIARSVGCEVSEWTPVEEQGWKFEIDGLRKVLRPTTKLVVVNFPHNPTGSVPTEDEYREIVAAVAENGAYLLSDEMYRYLEVEPGSTLPAGCELYERAFSLFGLSKSFGLPGLRIGWLAGRDRAALQRMSGFKDYTSICNSAPSEILAIMAMRNRKQIVASQCQRVRANVEVLDSFFAEFADLFYWNRPIGGSVCLPRMQTKEGTRAFCERLVEEAGIMLVPSSMFGFGNDHVRVGFGRQNLPEVVQQLRLYLRPEMSDSRR